jgi:VanZ family protein
LVLAAVIPAKRRDPPRSPPYGIDKAAHAVGHAAFAAALADAFGPTDRPPGGPGLAVLLSAGSGVLLERLQRWVPGRRFERDDVVAGAVGSVLGAAGVLLWRAASTPAEDIPPNER